MAVAKKLTWNKSRLINVANDFEALLDSISDAPTKKETETIKVHLDAFNPTQEEMQNIASELFDLAVDISAEEREYRKKYLSLIGLDKSKLEQATAETPPRPASSEKPQIRLPVIEIPTFTGKYDEWPGFSDAFTSLIHSNEALSNVDRFHYLQSALKGKAATILRSLKLSDAGYVLAWERLTERYKNERFIVKKHVRELLNLAPVKRDNHTSLQDLIDTVAINLASLKARGRPTDHWGDMIVEIVSTRLDFNLQKEWEGQSCNEIPTYAKLETFLKDKCKQLEAVKSNMAGNNASEFIKPPKTRSLVVNQTDKQCVLCDEDHTLFRCNKFLGTSVADRINFVKQKNLCYNCLGNGHGVRDCKSGSCRECKKRHHTLLYLTPSDKVQSANLVVGTAYAPARVLLSTCVVTISDAKGNTHYVRALLDSGSQANLITEACADRISLDRNPIRTPIAGIGGSQTQSKQVANFEVESRTSSYALTISALVIDHITDNLPARYIERHQLKIPSGAQLADPKYFKPQPVELLLGAGVFFDILREGSFKGQSLTLHNSHFGWIIAGEMPETQQNVTKNKVTVGYVGLNEVLSRFWELEHHKQVALAPLDQQCERHFAANTIRDATGRFQVALPFKDNPNRLGNSSEYARHRFFSLERRLAKNPSVHLAYREFMREFEQLGHMHRTSGDVQDGYYLPHHCVIKENSLTTKLRVVFNGSAPTSSGLALNDLLLVGPPIQDDLFAIMLRMRTKQYLITADITKMYRRQVNIRPADRKYQRIWWRETPQDELKSYELATVTYGTACAAYLAIRSLRELAHLESQQFPIGSQRCLTDFYVDDLITGADTNHELRKIRDEVTALLAKGGFELRRWASNCKEAFNDFNIDTDDQITVLTRDNNDQSDSITTLGTIWNTNTDQLSYKCTELKPRSAMTKRQILSQIARIYDPLGLVGPVTITAKIIIQDLWKLKCSWDDPLPLEYADRWYSYADKLPQVSNIILPRKVIPESNVKLELHGFADASEQAYGACLYLVALKDSARISCNLLCAKSRVAPVKATSIPRLELCAALLLSELTARVREALDTDVARCFLYTDSKITLSWIKSESRRFKTFIANRIGEIHKTSDPRDWYHVSTTENPADIISRGISADQLINTELWWSGPGFILNQTEMPEFYPEEHPPEIKCNHVVANDASAWLPKCSSFEKTARTMSYVLRFLSIRRGKTPATGPLTVKEKQAATISIVKAIQRATFSREIELMLKGAYVHKTSKLCTLNPYIDADGLIRVGGRLLNSDLQLSQRCPIVLPAKHPMTELIITKFHKVEMHSGAQGTLAAIRREYWILNGRSAVRGIIRKCVKCIRAKSQFQPPMMAALPKSRTTPFRPFLCSGIDYCGPFTIKDGSHNFLAALYRFIARRGNVREIWSDNATNFIGARNHLRELGSFLSDPENVQHIEAALRNKNIDWKFIPPRAPQFGGLWEAAVKSFKNHLQRVAGNAMFTFEELNTLLIEIEAVLNSRPLCPLSEDPNDYSALTPGHFLIGEALTAPVDPNYEDVPENRLSRWQLVEKMRQHVWKRWSREYLSGLHQRTKWQQQGIPVKEGQLVIIKEDNLPPLQWRLGRVQSIHPGSDGVARSATIRTSSGELQRPIIKLCPLLYEEQS